MKYLPCLWVNTLVQVWWSQHRLSPHYSSPQLSPPQASPCLNSWSGGLITAKSTCFCEPNNWSPQKHEVRCRTSGRSDCPYPYPPGGYPRACPPSPSLTGAKLVAHRRRHGVAPAHHFRMEKERLKQGGNPNSSKTKPPNSVCPRKEQRPLDMC